MIVLRMLILMTLVLSLNCVTSAQMQPKVDQHPSTLELRLWPVVLHASPLTKALSDIGAKVREGYVLFGAEILLEKGKEPVVDLNLDVGETVGDALQQIINQLPGYTFKAISPHIINVYPKGATEDPNDILNLRVPQFDAVNTHPSDVLSRPQHFISELKARLTPQGSPQPTGYIDGIHGSGPTVTVHLRNTTVREILNAVSEATDQFPATDAPLGWMYTFLRTSQSGTGGIHSWMFLWSAPSTWKKQQEQEEVPKP